MTNVKSHTSPILLGSIALLYPLAVLADTPKPSPADGETTMLEPVFVEASTQTPWRYLSIPGYEILSHCPEDFNTAYVRALRDATAARLAFLPASFWGEMATPMKIVLYDRAPEKREGIVPSNPVDLSWAPENRAIVGSGSVQLTHPATVGDGDTYLSCGNYWSLHSASSGLSVDPDSEILLENRVPRFPAWFVAAVEGPCGIYVNRLIKSGPIGAEVVLPNALWTSLTETIAIQNESREKKKKKNGSAKHVRTLLPLRDLFGGHVGPGQETLWNAESALLVRWGLFRSGARKGFLDFVEQASKEPVTEELFRQHLGMGYADAERQMGDYLPAAVTETIRLPLGAQTDVDPQTRDASSAEVARIIGDWGRLEGKSAGVQFLEYRSECLEQADKLFERASRGRSGSPLLQAAFGLYKIQVGDSIRGRAALEAAAKAGVVRPRAYVELARLRLREALPSVRQGIGDLNESDFEAILGLLRTAREQMPSFMPAYQVLAQAYEHAPSKPARADLGELDEALRLSPRDAALAYKIATLYGTFGYKDEADAIIRRALLLAETDDARALLSSWHPRPAGG